MRTCIVCSKEVKDNEDFEYNLDGDRIHKKCKLNLKKHYDRINNMSDMNFIII